tara:strand:- start:4664 stop:6238 length:1575 start_codon:yes stop_codon:yes gene_type:complete
MQSPAKAEASVNLEDLGSTITGGKRNRRAADHDARSTAAVPRSLIRGIKGTVGLTHGIKGAVGVAFVLEFLTVTLIGMGIMLLRSVDGPVSGTRYLLASLFCASTIVFLLDYQSLYEEEALLDARRSIPSIITAGLVAFGGLLITGIASAGHLSYGATWLAAFASASVLTLIAGRISFARFLSGTSARGLFTRQIIIIGAGETAVKLLQELEAAAQPWTRVLGLFDDRVRDASGRVPRSIGHVHVIGTVSDAITFARRMRVDDIVIALPWSANERINALVRATESVSANIHIASDCFGSVRANNGQRNQTAFPALRISPKPLSGWSYLLKRATDLAIAIPALILLAPLFLIVAIALKLESRGPVFFRQPRFGINNRTINIFKFRSMYHAQQDLRADRLVTRDDPRVTPIGRFLRRTSIDELPQLLNVISGEMSIVGPRPHAKNAKAAGRIYQEVVQEYARRHRVKPGITGWAQVKGWRGETDTEEKIIRRCEHDLYYIDNCSFLLDIYIIVATFVRAPFQRNAF